MKGFISLLVLTVSLAFSQVNAEEPAGPVNINTASVEELSELKGVGKAKAEAIVAHREEHHHRQERVHAKHRPEAHEFGKYPSQSGA